MHYSRGLRHGNPLAHPKVDRGVCSVPGCDRPHEAYGKCKSCYGYEYRAANADRRREVNRRWHEANRERAKRQSAAYYQEHRDEIRARVKTWYLDNQPRVRGYRDRRLRRLGVDERTAAAIYVAALERDGMVCHLCGGEIAGWDDLHFDHVIPLSRGGQHVVENVRPAHRAGNRWKHTLLMEELTGDPPCKVA